MSDLTLINHRHRLKAFVRMSAHSTFFVAGRELIRGGIVEQQKRTQLKTKAIVVKYGADGETVANPVHFRTLMDTK